MNRKRIMLFIIIFVLILLGCNTSSIAAMYDYQNDKSLTYIPKPSSINTR